MTADVELLPYPHELKYMAVATAVKDYARANIAIHTAAKDAEIEALRARLDSPPHAHIEGKHLNAPQDGCLLCEAIAEREALRAEVEALKSDLSDYMQAANYQATRAERLAEELRDTADCMKSQAKWRHCDCGCPDKRAPIGDASVAWTRAATMLNLVLLRDQEEGK